MRKEALRVDDLKILIAGIMELENPQQMLTLVEKVL